MFFLLRMGFWLCVVLALLPSAGTEPVRTGPAVSAIETLSAAGAAVSDMGQFCERQPEACDVGAQAASAFGQRAQAGAKMVLEFIGERIAGSETGSISTVRTPVPPVRPAHSSQHTLNPADMKPVWRGPARKDT